MTRVLVIDDEPQILRALRRSLEAQDYEVATAEDGEEGLALAAERTPNLVVLDLGLPDLDGTEVIRRLRSWTDVPVIVLSVREGRSAKIDALDAGADDYVTKPSTWRSCSRGCGPRSAVPTKTWPPSRKCATEISTVDLARRLVASAARSSTSRRTNTPCSKR